MILDRWLRRREDPPPETWSLNGADWPIRLTRRPGGARITLRLCAMSDTLRVAAPAGCPVPAIREAIAAHADGLARQAARLPPRRGFRDGAAIPFRGETLTIVHESSARGGIDPDKGLLIVGGRPEHLPRRVRDALRRAALAELKTACDDAFARAGEFSPRPLKAVRIADPRGRWGSCAADGTLRFSWRLILAPPEILAYVAAHEVAHLAEMSHGPKFWKVVAALGVDSATARAWLKRHGAELHRVGPPGA